MMSKVFIDTNLLVYSVDKHDKKKQTRCRGLLKKLASDKNGVLSTQVLQEFFVSVTKKLKVDPLVAKGLLHFFENFETVVVTGELIKNAIDCSILNQISFWDSLILAAAENSKCTQLWTEDLNAGQIIYGVEVVNPIK